MTLAIIQSITLHTLVNEVERDEREREQQERDKLQRPSRLQQRDLQTTVMVEQKGIIN